jgi:hypothetical protein
MSTPNYEHKLRVYQLQRERWRKVIAYEVWMLGETSKMPHVVLIPLLYAQTVQNAFTESYAQTVQNAFTESQVLHARNLCEFCCLYTGWVDPIKPNNLFEKYHMPAYDELKKLVNSVRSEYNRDACPIELPDGKSELHSPRWAFNKMFAHPTRNRGLGFNYGPFVNLVYPKIKALADEIRRLEKQQGRDFPSLPDTPLTP